LSIRDGIKHDFNKEKEKKRKEKLKKHSLTEQKGIWKKV